MNLRDLEYLVAVDEERHFHKAAERCFVSQPTLSGQLKKLEDELGVLLVERTRRQVVMTDVGEAVANQARTVLADAKAIKDIVQTFDDPMAGELHAGAISLTSNHARHSPSLSQTETLAARISDSRVA